MQAQKRHVSSFQSFVGHLSPCSLLLVPCAGREENLLAPPTSRILPEADRGKLDLPEAVRQITSRPYSFLYLRKSQAPPLPETKLAQLQGGLHQPEIRRMINPANLRHWIPSTFGKVCHSFSCPLKALCPSMSFICLSFQMCFA